MRKAVGTVLVATGIAAPVVAFFTGHAPPYYRDLSVFITPTLGLISFAIIRALPKRANLLLVLSILSIGAAITLLAVYFQQLTEWTVANPAHPTTRYQVGRRVPESLTPYGRDFAARYPNDTAREWFKKKGYSEATAELIWTDASRAETGRTMLFIYILAVVLWTGGNELLKQSDPAVRVAVAAPPPITAAAPET